MLRRGSENDPHFDGKRLVQAFSQLQTAPGCFPVESAGRSREEGQLQLPGVGRRSLETTEMDKVPETDIYKNVGGSFVVCFHFNVKH